MSSCVSVEESERASAAKRSVAWRLLQPHERIVLALLIGPRVAVGVCDLLLATAMYWLFVILQGQMLIHRFSWIPASGLRTAAFASLLVLVRALLDISSSRSVFRYIQALSSDFLLRLSRGYSQMDWCRFVERNRSELSGHALYTSREAADFYHRCIELLSGVVTIGIMTTALVYQNSLAAAMFACALAVFWMIHRFVIRKDITRAAADRESALRSLQRELADLFSSGKELRSYNNYALFGGRLRRHSVQFALSSQRAVFLPQVSRTIADQGTVLLFLVFIIVVECLQDDSHQLLAVLAFYFVLSRRLLPLISQLAIIFGQMESSYENVKILAAELDECDRCKREDCEWLPPAEGLALEIRDLNFAYSQGHPILRKVNLAVADGEIVVLRGTSGTGKSSLLNLIAGILSPGEGRIMFRRGALAYVPQEITLLDASIRENLLFGLQTYSDEGLMNALRIANLEAFVASLPGGLDTKVGDNGSLFSGGERQRLGIARAVLRGSRLLLLDEATSALDPRTENRVLANLRATGVTVVLATHRAHHLVFADRMFRLEAGCLIEERPDHEAADGPKREAFANS